ncbi:MAG: zinc-dependent metalloprotease [Vicinamibacterales bacterium]
MLGQWALEMHHVATIVGGYNSQQKHIGQTGVRFQLIPRAKQEGAVKFLLNNAFKAPKWALNEEILRRIEPVGVIDRVEASQTRVLNSLLSTARVTRLVEQEALDGNAAYAPLDFLADVRKGVFSELYGAGPGKSGLPIDAYCRNLQRAYSETLSNRINDAQAQSDDVRAFFRGELKALDTALTASSRDRETALHIDDLRLQIARALDPTVQAAAAAARRAGTSLDDEKLFDVTAAQDSCWIDYVVKPRKSLIPNR